MQCYIQFQNWKEPPFINDNSYINEYLLSPYYGPQSLF